MTYDEPSDVDWRDVVEEDSDDEEEVEEKHLPTQHDQKKHAGQALERNRPVSRDIVRKVINRLWDTLPESSRGRPDKKDIDNLYDKAKEYVRLKSEGKITEELFDYDADELDRYKDGLVESTGKSVEEILDTVQGVKNDLGYTNKNAWGYCAVASTLLWYRLDKPKNLAPTSVMWNEEEHVILYDKTNDFVLDITASQFGDKTFRIGSKSSFDYKSYVKFTSRDLRAVILSEIAPILTVRGKVEESIPDLPKVRGEKARYLEDGSDDLPGLLLVLPEIVSALESDVFSVEKSDRALLNQYVDDVSIEKQPDFLEYIKQRVKIADPYAINNRVLLDRLWKEFTAMVGPSYPQINFGTQANYGEVLRSAIDDVWKHLPSRHDQREHGRKKWVFWVKVVGDASARSKDLVKEFLKRVDFDNRVINKVEVLSQEKANEDLGEEIHGKSNGEVLLLREQDNDLRFELEFLHELGHSINNVYPTLAVNYKKFLGTSREYRFLYDEVRNSGHYKKYEYDREVFASAYSLGMYGSSNFPESVAFFNKNKWVSQ